MSNEAFLEQRLDEIIHMARTEYAGTEESEVIWELINCQMDLTGVQRRRLQSMAGF